MTKTHLYVCIVIGMMVCTGTVWAVTPSEPAAIEGFRDLKFGMTPQEVEALDACSTSSECLYPLEGKNRYVYPGYGEEGSINRVDAGSRSSDDAGQLTHITIDMGRFDEDLFAHLQGILTQHYRLTQDTTDDLLEAFHNGQRSEIVQVFGNGQILLKVVRRKFGNLVTKMVYLAPAMVKKSGK